MYLSLDLSLSNTGWCLFDKYKRVINFGCIQGDMVIKITELILITGAMVVIIENTHGGVNVGTTMVLCKLQGKIVNMANNIGVYVVLLSCNSARRLLFGQNMNKQETISYTKYVFNIPDNEHIIDAFVLGMGYLFRNEP